VTAGIGGFGPCWKRSRPTSSRDEDRGPAANDILQSLDADEQRLIDAALDEAVRRKFGEVQAERG
jgi:hypothetical protein